MREGNFIFIPLAADGKIAVGQPTVGVRCRMLGTELSHTVTDPELSFWQLKDLAKAQVQRQADELARAREIMPRSFRYAEPYDS